MRTGYVAVFAVLAALLLPGAARAQYFDCDSYMYYDGNALSGYSRTVDYNMEYVVGVESTLYDPYHQQIDQNSDFPLYFTWAEADVYGYPYNWDNWYSIEGRHWYWDYSWCWYGCWEELPGSYSSIYVQSTPPPIVQYPPGYLDEMPGELLDYGSVDDYGGVSNALLDPDAFDYLVSSGFLQATETWPVLVAVPGIGEVVEAIFVVYVVYEAVEWLHRRGLGSDPAVVKALPREVAGTRDGNGNCGQVQPFPNYKWQARDKPMQVWGPIHWHWITWNLDQTTCLWHYGRDEGPNDPGPGYVLLLGVFFGGQQLP